MSVKLLSDIRRQRFEFLQSIICPESEVDNTGNYCSWNYPKSILPAG